MASRQPMLLAALCCCATLLELGRDAAAVTYTGVGIYDESATVIAPNETSNQVDTNAAAGTGVGTNVSVAQFTVDVLNAYNNNVGGVCDFEGPTITNDLDTSFNVTYGAAQAKMLTVNLTTASGGTPANAFETGQQNTSLPVSGIQYYGLSTGSAYGLTFSKPLVAIGITALSRTANRTVNSVTITLDDATTYIFGSEPITASVAGVNGPDDTFFGYAAPAGRTITRIAVVPNNSMRWDELGFITAPDAPPPHPGDFNSDGDVDGADFVAWQTNFPKASLAVLSEGDADSDGDVDGADFVIWQTNFPFTPSTGTVSIPEPSSMILLLFTCIGLILVYRRHCLLNFDRV
jgi:hypothetical protein